MPDNKVDTLQATDDVNKPDANNDNVKIIYKRPEYLRESQRKHYNKNKDNPEFMEKQLSRIKKYREENRDRVNELARLRRRKKKEEESKKAASHQSIPESTARVDTSVDASVDTSVDAITDKMGKVLEINE